VTYLQRLIEKEEFVRRWSKIENRSATEGCPVDDRFVAQPIERILLGSLET
jgi:hypothetical protein